MEALLEHVLADLAEGRHHAGVSGGDDGEAGEAEEEDHKGDEDEGDELGDAAPLVDRVAVAVGVGGLSFEK